MTAYLVTFALLVAGLLLLAQSWPATHSPSWMDDELRLLSEGLDKTRHIGSTGTGGEE